MTEADSQAILDPLKIYDLIVKKKHIVDDYLIDVHHAAYLVADVAAALRAHPEPKPPRMFPVQDGPAIPWEVIAPFDKQCQRNHGGQTLEDLARRGGLGTTEAIAVLLGVDYFDYWEHSGRYRRDDHAKHVLQLVALIEERSGWKQRAEKAEAELAALRAWRPPQEEEPEIAIRKVLTAFEDLSIAEVRVFGGFIEYAGRTGREQTTLREALAELSNIYDTRSAGRGAPPPDPQEQTTALELFSELELALYEKSCNTWEVNRAERVMRVIRKALAALPPPQEPT